MPIGPSLPPHLAKRSRDDSDDLSSSPESDGKRQRIAGPAPPPSKPSPARVVGPSLPPQSRSRSSSADSNVGPAPPQSSKPTRTLGPAPPPAHLDERPPNAPPDEDSDSSDDDFGPAPPPAGATYNTYDEDKPAPSAFDTDPHFTEEAKKVRRDDWMTMPPTHDDLSRIDPTKMRARKFNTGKSTGGGGGDGMGIWTETPEQKLKRLQDEAMGIAAPANSSASPKKEARRNQREEERARKMRESIEATRGQSLVEQHKEKSEKEKEDDPSKRVFDYEKDMAVSTKVTHKQKREMLSNAKGFGGRFSSGSYL